MAMNKPRTGVVELEGDGEIAIAGQNGDISARRVHQINRGCCFIPGPDGLSDDEEVVAVEMDGVVETDSSVINNDKGYPLFAVCCGGLI